MAAFFAMAQAPAEIVGTTSGVNRESCALGRRFVFPVRCPVFASPSREMVDKERDSEKSVDEIVEHDFAKPEMQQARAFLRERFLRVVTGIVGKPSEFILHEASKVSGEFRGCDVDGLEVYVRDLETPLGKVPEAILRTTDIIHFTVNNVVYQQW